MSLLALAFCGIVVLVWCFYAVEKVLLRVSISMAAIAERLEPPISLD